MLPWQVVDSIMMVPWELRVLLVPSWLPRVEVACRLPEELLVGVSEKYLGLLKCQCRASLLPPLPSCEITEQ